MIVPPRGNVVAWEEGHPRTQALEQIKEKGMADWQATTNYHRHSIAKNAMYRLKQLFGERLSSRKLETQVVEVHARITALNTMTYLGMPVSVRVETSVA